jgi:hypothetical protein
MNLQKNLSDNFWFSELYTIYYLEAA